MTDHHGWLDHHNDDEHHEPVHHDDDQQPHDLDAQHDDLTAAPDHDWLDDAGHHHTDDPVTHDADDTPYTHDTHTGDLPPAEDHGVFPPALDVGPLPEPVDGFPWIDTGSLGVVDPAALHTTTDPVDPHELAAYAATDLPPGADPWAALADSDDPATANLARWWADNQQ